MTPPFSQVHLGPSPMVTCTFLATNDGAQKAVSEVARQLQEAFHRVLVGDAPSDTHVYALTSARVVFAIHTVGTHRVINMMLVGTAPVHDVETFARMVSNMVYADHDHKYHNGDAVSGSTD